MSVWERNRDIIPEEYNFSRQHIKDFQWDWLFRTERGVYNKGMLQGGALAAGAIHGWLWQQVIFQWTPSMCKLTRTPIFALPTMFLWYSAEEFFRTRWTDYHSERHLLQQKLNRCATAAKQESWRQQAEGLAETEY